MSADVNTLTICFIRTHAHTQSQFMECQFPPDAFASCISHCNGRSRAAGARAVPGTGPGLDPTAGVLFPCCIRCQDATCSLLSLGKPRFDELGCEAVLAACPHPCPDLQGCSQTRSLPWPSGLNWGEPAQAGDTPRWLWLFLQCQILAWPGVTLGCPSPKPCSSSKPPPAHVLEGLRCTSHIFQRDCRKRCPLANGK